jgi:hypothetical protein
VVVNFLFEETMYLPTDTREAQLSLSINPYGTVLVLPQLSRICGRKSSGFSKELIWAP